ncbi:hypothetical protein KIN20_027969 [Parelaphostrongylus tenuis]|uniref:Glucuronosyltransferase n=1 Tax=Parelaphostrongylus tenuis TaxID=148309 RepID=A0AAD5WEF2_PARTN|nr:hypothetical protein KIN20_027969 [Parelaphostrongylus tenuis]
MFPWAFIYFNLFACDAYKFLINSPLHGYSHINFMGAIADALTEAGHNVTVLMPMMSYEHKDRTGLKLTKNVIKIPPDPRLHDVKHEEEIIHMWTGGTSVLGLLKGQKRMETESERIRMFIIVFQRSKSFDARPQQNILWNCHEMFI